MTPPGPPDDAHQIEDTSVPVTIAAPAPHRLNRRQYSARIVTGPKAAPMPPHA